MTKKGISIKLNVQAPATSKDVANKVREQGEIVAHEWQEKGFLLTLFIGMIVSLV